MGITKEIGIRAATIVIKDRKVLLVKSNYSGEEIYLFPGGGVEFKETAEECAIRETFEETGVKVKIKDLFHVNEYIYAYDWNKRSISMFFMADALEVFSPQTKDGGKIIQAEWVSLDKLEDYNIKPKNIAQMIKNYPDLDDSKLYSVDFKKKS